MILVRKIATVFMAGLLLVASIGVTLNKHYCMGRLKHVAIFEKAQSCMDLMGFEEEEDCLPGCCRDVSQEFKVDDLKKSTVQDDLTPDMKVLAVVAYFLIDFRLFNGSTQHSAYLNYKPPLIDLDIPVLVQSFLL